MLTPSVTRLRHKATRPWPEPTDRARLMVHRSRLCQIVIDVDDLDQGVQFWTAALDATHESLPETSGHIYCQLRLPDSDIRLLLQRTKDPKRSKERSHLDI